RSSSRPGPTAAAMRQVAWISSKPELNMETRRKGRANQSRYASPPGKRCPRSSSSGTEYDGQRGRATEHVRRALGEQVNQRAGQPAGLFVEAGDGAGLGQAAQGQQQVLPGVAADAPGGGVGGG